MSRKPLNHQFIKARHRRKSSLRSSVDWCVSQESGRKRDLFCPARTRNTVRSSSSSFATKSPGNLRFRIRTWDVQLQQWILRIICLT
eukprot:1925318-Rhodomonas_salina.2